jgi:hypothetical protein
MMWPFKKTPYEKRKSSYEILMDDFRRDYCNRIFTAKQAAISFTEEPYRVHVGYKIAEAIHETFMEWGDCQKISENGSTVHGMWYEGLKIVIEPTYGAWQVLVETRPRQQGKECPEKECDNSVIDALNKMTNRELVEWLHEDFKRTYSGIIPPSPAPIEKE